MYTNPRIDSLPVWAKIIIRDLSIEIKNLSEENKTLREREKEKETRVSVHPLLQDVKFFLGDSDVVKFRLGDDDSFYSEASVSLEKDHLRISLADMVIKPIVTNVIEIHRGLQ